MMDSGSSSGSVSESGGGHGGLEGAGETGDTVAAEGTTDAETEGTAVPGHGVETAETDRAAPTGQGSLEHPGGAADKNPGGSSGVLDTNGASVKDIADSKSFAHLSAQAKENAVDHAKRNSYTSQHARLEAIREGPDNARLDATPPGVLGGHNMDNGSIVCKNSLDNSQAAHVAQHEFTHRTSFQDVKVAETDDARTETRVSGIRTLVRETNKQTGVVEVKSDANRSLNEGITEREAIATEVEVYGKPTDCGLKCYTANMDYAAQLEALVGRETVTSAYYSGDLDSLSKEVNTLAKDETAWTDLNAKLDKVCASRDGMTDAQLAEVQATKFELDALMARMAETKAQIEAQKQKEGGISSGT